MPVGTNPRWRRYLEAVVGHITASDPEVVLHAGDMVEGRWFRHREEHQVFGRSGTPARDRRVIRRAADTIYPWIRRFWTGHDVLWGIGDHELGDMGSSGSIAPTTLKYRTYEDHRAVWRRHFGPIRHARRVRNVGVLTLDPFVKEGAGVFPGISERDQRWMADRVRAWRRRGVDWILVQSEIPAVGPNRGRKTSGLLLRNGGRVWSLLDELGVDLLLAGEYHADTTRSRRGATPVQVVHGGRQARTSWLEIDVYGDERLELTLWETRTRRGTTWAMNHRRDREGPVAGAPRVIGSALITSDRRIRQRTGFLREGRRPGGRSRADDRR